VLTPVMASPDPLAFTPGTGNVDFVTAATRAYILAWMGRWVEALDLVTDVAEIRPDVPYLKWAEWWMSQPGVLAQIKWEDMRDGILADLAKIAMRCPVPIPADDPRLPNVQAAGRLIDQVRGAYPREAFVWITGSLVNRRLGNAELGLAMAQQAYHLEPNWRGAVGVANAYKEQRNVDEAASWYRKALTHDPDDTSALCDLSDLYLEAERWAEVIQTADAVLAKGDNNWVAANRYYAYYRQSGQQPGHKLALLRLTEADGDVQRARELMERIDPPVPYVTTLPGPGDASNNGLEDVFQRMWKNPAAHMGSTLRLDISHVEAPSVLAAFHCRWRCGARRSPSTTRCGRCRRPIRARPRRRCRGAVAVGRRGAAPGGGQARLPADGEAQPAGQRAVLARPVDPGGAAAGARAGAGRDRRPAGVPVHPPRPTGGSWRVLPWTQRVQIATTLVLAHIDGGWQGSQRQQILFALLYGPTDWTTGAAIVALGALARTEPDLAQRALIRRDVEQAFGWLRTQIPARASAASPTRSAAPGYRSTGWPRRREPT
jgi:hypothetical protein